MFSQKHSLLTAAILASLSLSACGKKQDLYTPPPEAAPVKTEEAPKGKSKTLSSPRSSKRDSDFAEPNLGGGLSEDSDENSRTGQLPEPGNSGNSDKGTPNNPYGEPPGHVGNEPRPPRPPTPHPPAPPTPRPHPPEPTPSEPSESSSKSYTGGLAQDGLSYTSSSTDSLLDFLRARNARVDEDTRRGNLALAVSVNSAHLDSRNGDAVVTLNLNEQGAVRTYVLIGDMRSGPAAKLEKKTGGETNGSRAADGTLKCVDEDGGCENVFARLRIGTPGSASIVSIVFRNSGANLFFDLPGVNSGSRPYLTLRDFMRNKVARNSARIVSSSMSSWEVVNGRSGFAVTMKGNNSQSLSYAGPLVAVQDSDEAINVSLDNRARSEYASWITGARLISNDTNGRLQVRLSVQSGERFVIKFKRQVKPIIPLSDDNLR